MLSTGVRRLHYNSHGDDVGNGAGIKLAVVSNFDTRLRPLLTVMGAAEVFDTLIISAEVGNSRTHSV